MAGIILRGAKGTAAMAKQDPFERSDDHPTPQHEPVAQLVAPTPRPAKRKANGSNGAPHQTTLSHGTPLSSARVYVSDQHTLQNGHVTLQRHQGDFHVWDGTVYRRMEDDAMRAALYAWLDKAVVANIDKKGTHSIGPFNPTKRKVDDVQDALRAQAYIDTDLPSWIGEAAETMPDLTECIVTQSAIVHLPTSECFPPTAELFTASCMSVRYDPGAGAEPEEWLKFLQSMWPDDQEAIDTLQQVVGYLLTPDTIQQKLFMIVGPPRSGKGTIARVLTAILGADTVACPKLAEMLEPFGMQPLIGKYLALISDMRLSGKTDQARVVEHLLSISGEDGVTIGRKYKNAWSGRLRIRFLMLANRVPTLSDASGALSSRFVIIQQKISFLGREDTDLERRLKGELPAILNWAIEGWKKLRDAKRFTMPKSSEEAVRSLQTSSSPVAAFVEEECELLIDDDNRENTSVAGTYKVGSLELYEQWARWCARRGRPPGSDASFGTAMAAAFPDHIKKARREVPRDASEEDQERVKRDRKYYFFGIRLPLC